LVGFDVPNPAEHRLTTKMTSDQLLGLHREARARTATLSPEIEIVDPDLLAVVAAIGTQESIPIYIEDVVIEPRRFEPVNKPVHPIAPTDHRAAIVGLLLLGVLSIVAAVAWFVR